MILFFKDDTTRNNCAKTGLAILDTPYPPPDKSDPDYLDTIISVGTDNGVNSNCEIGSFDYLGSTINLDLIDKLKNKKDCNL